LSKSFTVAAVSMAGSPDPSAVVDSLGLPLPDALGLGEALGLAEAAGELEADVLGDGVDVALSLLALTAWPEPPDEVALADEEALGEEDDAAAGGLDDPVLALGDVLALGVAEPDGAGVGVVVGGGPVVVLFARSRTCRIRSNAVSPTSVATFWAPAPGTETTIWLVPCWTTDEPVRPVASTRFVMIWIAWVIELWLTGFPCGDTALSVMDVPLERSSPSPTLKLLCQSAGLKILPPSTLSAITISSTIRAVRYRPGYELGVLRGATSALVSR
jgi:hypothetical protein